MTTKSKTMIAAAAALFSLPAFAADPWEAPFTLQVGAYNPEAETKVRLDSTSGRFGTQVSFEGDLGGEDRKTVPTLDLLWRINSRHALEGSIVSLRREGQTALSATIDFGDRTFPINSVVDSSFDSDVVRLAYRWSPVHTDRAELGLLVGLHYTRLETTLSARGSSVSLTEEAAVDYPLPTIGLRGTMRLGDNWRVTGFGQFLKLKIDEYEGDMLNVGVGVEWFFGHGMFAGLGYDYYKYNLVSTKDNARGEFDYVFEGPRVYFGWNFR
jgi:opacity protein-like surface antigen